MSRTWIIRVEICINRLYSHICRIIIKNVTKLCICKHGKLFIGRTCKKRADDLLKLDRHQLKLIAAILTGHAPVRGHLRTIGLCDRDPSCRFCGLETETVQHLVCCCEASSHQRYNVFEELTIEPNVIHTATVTCVSLSVTQGYLNCAELGF